MDQAKFESLLADFKQHSSTDNSIFDLEAKAGSYTSPLVLLVHGIGGNAQHWFDPSTMNVNDTWLFDLTSHPTTKKVGLSTSIPYQPQNVTSWTNFLNQNSITYVNFSQAKAGDLLEYATKEVVDLLTGLEEKVFQPFAQDATANNEPVPPLIILCHSRGGLVTRAALKQLGSSGTPHLKKVITLCTPHHGSFMPRLSNDYNNTLHQQLDFTHLADALPGPIRSFFKQHILDFFNDLSNQVRQALLHSFGTLAQSPGFDELIPESPTLQALKQDEQPLPGVQYYSFGGSNPTFVNFFLSLAGQTFKLLETASPLLVDMLSRIPGIHDTYGGLAELSRGDSAVSQTSSRWPDTFQALHQDLHLNHMQALVDPALQQSVLQTIRA